MSDQVAGNRPDCAGKSRKSGLWVVLQLLGLALAALTAAGFLGRWHWLFELTSHFRCQYMLMLAALALLLFTVKLRKSAALAAICCLLNAAVVLPLFIPVQTEEGRGEQVKVLFANVLVHNQDHQTVLRLIADIDPDVIVLVETDRNWLRGLDELKAQYPHSLTEPYTGAFGIAMFSRLKTASMEVVWVGEPAVPAILAKMEHGGRPMTLIGAHVFPPGSQSRLAMRNSQMNDLATLAGDQQSPCCLLGDLNTTPWSPYFRDLLHIGNLHDGRNGFGIQPSWPTGNWLLSIPIDHCLVQDGIQVKSRKIGPAIGSDHYPVIVDLVLQD